MNILHFQIESSLGDRPYIRAYLIDLDAVQSAEAKFDGQQSWVRFDFKGGVFTGETSNSIQIGHGEQIARIVWRAYLQALKNLGPEVIDIIPAREAA